ncbi:MAG: UDP-N-acetylglucosamine--N-acetylmuramyl-(pentapeptide) pyrophosphoryl-undecaprenol N-acetylglucosamine transferase, partial [Deltaproteobacteria bacterium]|nr:UDP-N-acetylglucosamine--N-acetylmuramyl-(pentapeptide) pyrophosphoryl-undecaprenol N-acetylglucosamine transferase [Deltaproteobacteria bacterium]
LGIKIVLHEQNILPGITNRLLSHVAERIYTSFEKAGTGLKSEKVRFTGNPVRKEFLENSLNHQKINCPEPENSEKPFTVVVAGGSQGSHAINMVISGALEYLENKDRFYFIHQTGGSDEKVVADAYLRHNTASMVKPFFYDMSDQYRKAALIICRSGATTVAEITAMGKGVIFIPFPKAADNHQVLNARWLADAGAVELILEKDISPRLLARRLKYYSSNPEALALMMSRSKDFGKPGAAKEIVDDCYDLLGA